MELDAAFARLADLEQELMELKVRSGPFTDVVKWCLSKRIEREEERVLSM